KTWRPKMDEQNTPRDTRGGAAPSRSSTRQRQPAPNTVQSRRIHHSHRKKEAQMPESVYKIIELVGTSSESWEAAAAAAVKMASGSLRDLRIAEIVELDMQ